MEPDLKPGKGARRILIAILGAIVAFCVVAAVVYYKMAHVAANGWMYSGSASMTAASSGLFVGGLAALMALVLLLQRR